MQQAIKTANHEYFDNTLKIPQIKNGCYQNIYVSSANYKNSNITITFICIINKICQKTAILLA